MERQSDETTKAVVSKRARMQNMTERKKRRRLVEMTSQSMETDESVKILVGATEDLEEYNKVMKKAERVRLTNEDTNGRDVESEDEKEASNKDTDKGVGRKGCENGRIGETEVGAGVGNEGTGDKAGNFAWMESLSEAHGKKVKVTVLLEQANLETMKQSGRSGGIVLLNSEDHRHELKKRGREANEARPDITHQCLLALMDSPLNKAGRLKVYIRTTKNVLIEVHAQTRIPRTIRRFSGLMAELLEKFKVRGTSGSVPLLKVIRNPITSHLAVGTRKIVCTYNTENVVDIREHAGKMGMLAMKDASGKKVSEEEIEQEAECVNVLYVIGAMAHGKVVEDWADEYICISEYPLSAATVCSRLVYAYECLFGIV